MEGPGTLARSSSSEMAPLLSNQSSDSESDERQNGNTNAIESSTNASRPPPPLITLLTTSTLFFAVGVVLFYGIAIILAQGLPRKGSLPWWAERSGYVLVTLSCLSILFSAVNLALIRRRSAAMPEILNLIIDLLISFYVAGAVFDGLNFAGDDDHYQLCKVYGIDGVNPGCVSRVKAINILLIVSFIFGALVSAVALILFTLRAVRLIRAFRQQQNRSWTIPAGQLTFEFTIKFLRQEQGEVRGPSAPETQ